MQSGIAILGDEAASVLALDGGLLNVAYEGIYFPIEDFLQALKPLLDRERVGKIDYIDMEGWTLTRYSIAGGLVTISRRGLNDALAYSGH